MKKIFKTVIIALTWLLIVNFAYAEEIKNIKGSDNGTYYEFNVQPVNAGNEGYRKNDEINDDKDPHYIFIEKGLGKFFITGFSGNPITLNSNEPIFLKTVGDELKIGFKLNENIDCLAGDKKMTIIADDKGYDGKFGTQMTAEGMGRGCLIIKHTNYKNETLTPTSYRDYLSGVTVGANTKLIPCEEGDYEVALDYAIKKTFIKPLGFEVLPNVQHYRLYFKFKIRNGNCIIFPKEISTGKELQNKAITEKGFYLDLANSHYLDTIVKKEVLKGDNTGLISDVRFNRAATDGEQFNEEGIYTISVYNSYINEQTEKKICVGNNTLLRANFRTGLPIEEINKQIADGAKINDDGSITPPIEREKTNVSPNNISNNNSQDIMFNLNQNQNEYYIGLVAGFIIILVLIIALINVLIKKGNEEAKVAVNADDKEAKAKSINLGKISKVLIVLSLIMSLITGLIWLGLSKAKKKNLEIFKEVQSKIVNNINNTNNTTESSIEEKEETIVETEKVIQNTISKVISLNYFDNDFRLKELDKFTDLSNDKFLRYVKDDIYQNLLNSIDENKYFVENVDAIYLSKEYLDEVDFNSKENIYFGFTLSDLNNQFQGKKYIFTVDENGNTIATISNAVEPDTTYTKALKNIAIGGGVILVCVTVSALTGGIAPAVSTIFAVSAKTGTVVALSSGAISGGISGIVTGIHTGNVEEAKKAALLKGSEGFKWGAIGGAIAGGAGEAISLHGATLNGLTMDEAAIIQRESGYPLDVIKNFKNFEQYNICKEASLKPITINNQTALMRPIDLNYMDEFGRTNLQRMQEGLAALDPSTGLPFELHHVGQKMDSTLAVLTKAEHMQGGNNIIWHEIGIDSEIDRGVFDTIRESFWEETALILMQ